VEIVGEGKGGVELRREMGSQICEGSGSNRAKTRLSLKITAFCKWDGVTNRSPCPKIEIANQNAFQVILDLDFWVC
jgi:hypothetical protein